ncbi:MAG: class I SAM-dependent methyltransferase [Proteobacteria bacterium]|nr:class I SAM-dependent methyltransferase [Pseudomonadota bacterium]
MSAQHRPSSYKQTFDARAGTYNEATRRYPDARENERKALLDLLDLKPGDRVCDTPAGGGFVADGITRDYGDAVKVVCVEPSAVFSEVIGTRFEVYNAPVEATGLTSGSFNAVASLAGLHHVEDRQPIFSEWQRLLVAGGVVAVADAASGTGTAAFLNSFLDRYTPGGHKGIFFDAGEFTHGLERAGFEEVTEVLTSVPWTFRCVDDMVDFCTRLFDVKAGRCEVATALNDTVGIVSTDSGVALQWELMYARGCSAQ